MYVDVNEGAVVRRPPVVGKGDGRVVTVLGTLESVRVNKFDVLAVVVSVNERRTSADQLA